MCMCVYIRGERREGEGREECTTIYSNIVHFDTTLSVTVLGAPTSLAILDGRRLHSPSKAFSTSCWICERHITLMPYVFCRCIKH